MADPDTNLFRTGKSIAWTRKLLYVKAAAVENTAYVPHQQMRIL